MAEHADSNVADTYRQRSGRAYWELQRRCAMIAGTANVLMLVVFQIMGLTGLALFSVGSIVVYALSYFCLQQRRNRLAVALMWSETIIHAAFGFLLAGPEGGAHYYLLLFFPALFLGASPDKAVLPAICILLLYFALDAWVYTVGTFEDVSKFNLALMRFCNSSLIAGILSYLAVYYRTRVVLSENELRKWATVDSLTGLPNRRYMDLTIKHLEAADLKTELAVIMADIDHFKAINDHFGHEGGDVVLRKVGEVISGCTREVDHVARWGGEEFLIILPLGSLEQAADAAERIRAAVEGVDFGALLHNDGPVKVSLTLGVSQRVKQEPLQTTIRRADKRLYAGKRQGRNQVCLHHCDDL